MVRTKNIISLPKKKTKIKNIGKLDWQEQLLIYFIFNSDKYKHLELKKITEGFSGEKVFYIKNIKNTSCISQLLTL